MSKIENKHHLLGVYLIQGQFFFFRKIFYMGNIFKSKAQMNKP